MTVHIQVIGQKEIERKLTPDIYLPSVSDVLRDSSTYAAREAQRGAGMELGAIAQSIGAVTVSPMETSVRSQHPGALAAEFGRRAGAPPPPVSALREWAARHGMAGFEFALAQAISRRGIKGRFFLQQAREGLERSELPRLLNRAVAEIERRWER